MIDKALMIIIFMYAAGFSLVGVQFMLADTFNITLVNMEGQPIDSAIRGWIQEDLTSWSQEWMNDSSTNYGFRLRSFNEDHDSEAVFDSKEGTNIPYLELKGTFPNNSWEFADIQDLNTSFSGELNFQSAPIDWFQFNLTSFGN